ncbi:MAG: hypothetical protein ABIJ09_09120 [Pseudomonadota bacterium]
MKRARRALLVLLVLGSAGCQRCARSEASLLDSIPGDASAVVLLQPLGAVAVALRGGMNLTQSQPEGAQAVEDLKQALGFDPTTVEGWQQAGLDPARPAALVAVAGEPVWLLPMLDGPRVLENARGLATKLWRADKVTQVQVAGRSGLRLARSFGDREVVLGLLVLDPASKLVLAANGDAGSEALGRVLATQPAQSLARSAAFAEDRALVRQGAVLLWTQIGDQNTAPAQLQAVAKQVSGAVASLGVDKGALWLEARARLRPEAAKESQALLASQVKPPDLLRSASAEAVLLAAGSADVPRMLQRLEAERGRGDLDALARSVGLDLNRDVLGRLAGGLGVVLYLEDPAPLLRHLGSARRIGQVLGRVLQVEAVAELTPQGSDGALATLDTYFRERQLEPSARSVAGGEVHTASMAGSDGSHQDFHYAVREHHLLVGNAPAERFDAWVQRRAGTAGGGLREGLSEGLRELLEAERGGRLYLSFRALADRLRQLSDMPEFPDPALRSTLVKAAGPLAALGQLAAHLQIEGDQLRLRLRVEAPSEPRTTP